MSLHPDYPVISGHYQLTSTWSLELPNSFNRRVEDGSLVIWHPGFTIWASAWKYDDGQSTEARLQEIKDMASSERFDEITETDGSLMRFAYRLDEDSEDERQPALQSYVLSPDSELVLAIYFDDPADLDKALQIWRSVAATAPSS